MSAVSPALIGQLRTLTNGLALPDAYQLRRVITSVPDGLGGQTETVVVVEAGMGLLKRGTVRPSEREIADRLGYQTPLVVLLPYTSVATPADTLVIAGRTLQIGGAFRGGAWGVLTTLICEERS